MTNSISSKKNKVKAKKTLRKKNQNSVFPKRWMDFACIALVTFIIFSPSLKNDFIGFDDSVLIYDNPIIVNNDFGGAFQWYLYTPHYKPIVASTWIMENILFDLSPKAIHFNNILIHILNCFLLYLFLIHLFGKFKSTRNQNYLYAFLATMLWSLHPLHVESIAWAVERKDVLFSFFYLLGLLSYTKFVSSNDKKWIFLVAGSYLLSMLCKGPGITLIGALFLYDVTISRKINFQLAIEKIPVFIVLLIGLWFYGVFVGGAEELVIPTKESLTEVGKAGEVVSGFERIHTTNFKFLLWLAHSILPAKLSIAYPRSAIYEWSNTLKFIHPFLTIGLFYLLWRVGKKNRLIYFAAGFFVLVLLPALVRTDLGIGICLSDRYTYLPLAGFILGIVLLVNWLNQKYLPNKSNLALLVLVPISLIWGVQSFMATSNWKDTETVWTNAIDKYPSIDYIYSERASFYRSIGDYDKAMKDINYALTLNPINPKILINRGNIYRSLKQNDLAFKDYDASIELDPNYVLALVNRGSLNGENRKSKAALVDLDRAIELDPENKDAYQNRMLVYFNDRNFEKALSDCDAYLKIDRFNKGIQGMRKKILEKMSN